MPTPYPLTIVTPSGKTFEQDVYSLQAPGQEGYFGIMANHAPMVIEISTGVVTVVTPEETAYFAVMGGIVEVSHNRASMLADLAQEADSAEEAKRIVAEALAEVNE